MVAAPMEAAKLTISRSELTTKAFSLSLAAILLITVSAVSPLRENLTLIPFIRSFCSAKGDALVPSKTTVILWRFILLYDARVSRRASLPS